MFSKKNKSVKIYKHLTFVCFTFVIKTGTEEEISEQKVKE